MRGTQRLLSNDKQHDKVPSVVMDIIDHDCDTVFLRFAQTHCIDIQIIATDQDEE